ncbi:unnamed protein product [Leptosia nina]|uniref:Peptidase S1 domain-containing protein n=1 Tax=Leptosia nina TaxID=320188 RepID=A0AAV1K094_9NEOP
MLLIFFTFYLFCSTLSFHDTVVKLKCENTTSCYGITLNPNLVLTTTPCAKSCMAILHEQARYDIEKGIYYPHLKKIRRTKHQYLPDKLALVRIKEPVLTSYAQLLSIDIENIVQLNGFIPLVERAPAYRNMLIKFCIFEFKRTGRCYICTNGHRAENCALQGIPLIVKGRVVAISEKQKLCNIQRAFISVSPYISWINSMLKHSKHYLRHSRITKHSTKTTLGNNTNKKEKINKTSKRREENKTHPKSRTTTKRRNIKEKRKSITPFKSADCNSCSRNLEPLQVIKSSTKLVKSLATRNLKLLKLTKGKLATKMQSLNRSHKTLSKRNTSKRLLTKNSSNIVQKNSTPNKDKSPSSYKPVPSIHRSISSTLRIRKTTSTSSKSFRNTKSLFVLTKSQKHTPRIPLSTGSNLQTSNSNTTNAKKNITMNLTQFREITDALDWFKKRFYDKLKTGPPPVFILTTSKIKKEFVDLT